jgi:endo-1,4-beta-xylanase
MPAAAGSSAAGGAAGTSNAGTTSRGGDGQGSGTSAGSTSSGGAGGDAGGGVGGSAGSPGGTAGIGGMPPLDATCGEPSGSAGKASGVASKYAGCFPIGAAVDSGSYTTHASLLKAHFNSVTAENEMKFAEIEPNEGSFSYASADAIVNFATTNQMKVRGHTLVWHSQNPSWLFENATKDVLLARMRKHISNVVTHYKGKVYAWDVVNEAIMEDGTYRDGNEPDDTKKSQWYAILGESYIAEAFKAAHEADPDAKLFYNDYYDYIPAKQQGIYKMLKGLLDQGIVVHGVGMQCHLNIEPSADPNNQGYYQDVAHLEDAIKLYSSLGLDVQVTELDLSLYVPGITYTSDQFYTTQTFTDALKAKQAARYAAFFELFRKYRRVITGVTFWGIADDNTWLSEFSSGRKDFPLLFDVNHDPKPAYTSVVTF